MALNDPDYLPVEVEFYWGDLAAYGLGRLHTRLSWHLKQAVLLSAGAVPDIGDSSLRELVTRTAPAGSEQGWDAALTQLHARMTAVSSDHRSAAESVSKTIASLAQQLPIPNGLAAAREIESSLTKAIAHATSEDAVSEVREANEAFRAFCLETPNDPSDEFLARAADEEFRRKLCISIADRYVTAPLTNSFDGLAHLMTAQQRELLALGQVLESGSLPANVEYNLTKLPQRACLSDRVPTIAKSLITVGRGLLAYQDRIPHQLLPDTGWMAVLRFHIARRSINAADLIELIQAAEAKHSNGTLTATDVRELAEEVEFVVSGNRLGSKQNGGDKRGEEKTYHSGPFGVLEIDLIANAATLRRGEKQSIIDRPSEIGVASLLIERGEGEVTYEELRRSAGTEGVPADPSHPLGSRNNDVQAIVSRLRKSFLEVGLKIQSVRDVGYRVAPE